MNEQKYAKFISIIDLNRIDLMSLEVKQNQHFDQRSESLDIAIDFEIGELNQNGSDIAVPMNFRIGAIFNTTEQPVDLDSLSDRNWLFKTFFTLELKYNLDISEVTEDLEDYSEMVEEFAERNVPANAWPYARELVSSMTTRMGFPPLFIPPYKKQPKF